MFKTIFSKLIAIFVAILLVSFSVAGVMLYYFLSDFVLKEKVSVLDKSAEKLNSFLKIYVENQNNQLTAVIFNEILESYSSSTLSLIWVVNAEGKLIFNVSGVFGQTIENHVKKQITDQSGILRLPDERQYKEVMAGKKEYIQENGDFYGLFKDTQVPWLTIEKPFKYIDNNGKEKVLGAVYLSTPIPEVLGVRTSVIKLFLISVSIAILVSIILVYIFSRRISKPLKQIRNAAKIIAGGEFHERLDIKSQDEVGELARSFNQMAVALQNLEEMRRGFIANVSHELRTPMTSIRGFIDGILDGVIPPEKHADYLKIVRDETSRLNRLVNDLLDLARMEAGETKLTLKNFDINELIRRCIIKLEAIIERKGILVEASFEEEDMLVNADADAIERVIINLVHNAIKFTDEKGKISLSTYSQKGKIYVSVQDTGIGIEKDELNLIWDRFYKSDKSRGKDKTGTGLGLAIIKNIVNEHKQEIWVESEVGEGTRFTFTLDKRVDSE
ncbi:MAG: cell wall metabolism sensor histidine kinase WalK [Clostridia bacterium]|nr:cell wall metabolism sensor histidine kinase WalK [Clostridia bacterium]